MGASEIGPLGGLLTGFVPFTFGHYFAHPDWSVVQVLATLLPGIVFGLLYHATGSLAAVMTAHTPANWIGSYPVLIYASTRNRAAGLLLFGAAIAARTMFATRVSLPRGA